MKFGLIALSAATALTLGACTTMAPGGYYGTNPPPPSSTACYDCGTVTRIDMTSGSTMPNATGAVIGGVVGAVAGHEIAKDNTDSQARRNVATAVGAAAGAAVGNAIQNRTQGNYNVTVRMNDGRVVTVSQADLGGIREGSYVRVYNGRAWAQ